MKKNKIRFATVGTSGITEKFLCEAAKNSDFELRAVYSRDRDRAEQFARQQGAEVYYDNLDAMAEDSGIDAVYLASPNAMHCAQAMRFMAAGKHVLCEKSLCSNLFEARRMFEAAEQNGVILMEAMRSLHDPGFDALKEGISKIGKIRRVSFRYCQYSSRYDAFKNGARQNIFDPGCSAGALMDIGVYCVEPMAALFGEPKSLQAVSVMLDGGIDGAGTVLADYGDMTAELVYSKITESHLPSEVQGEAGVLLIDEIACLEKIGIRYNDGRTKRFDTGPGGNNMRFELQAFADAVRGQKSIAKYREISMLSMKLMDRVRDLCGIRFPVDGEME